MVHFFGTFSIQQASIRHRHILHFGLWGSREEGLWPSTRNDADNHWQILVGHRLGVVLIGGLRL